MISTSFVTNRHALLAAALQTAREIKRDGNSIQFTLLNRFTYQIDSNQLFPALLPTKLNLHTQFQLQAFCNF